MRPGSLIIGLLLLIGMLHNSCKKEYSCEHCLEGNKPPVANAGQDQALSLPQDSIQLDGNASKDPDGTIASFSWKLIDGNNTAIIVNPNASTTTIKNLQAGVYTIELKVTDNEGLSDSDTMLVIANEPGHTSQPPIAKAGADQTYTSAVSTLTLDGSQSYDPDGTIVSYSWREVPGSNQAIFSDATKPITSVNNVTGDHYIFELTVTDNDGLSSKDTIQIFISLTPDCQGNRPVIDAELVPVENLIFPASGALSATAGNKILFIGGFYHDPFLDWYISSTVLIYDYVTHASSNHTLSIPRQGMSVAISGSKIYIAGGYDPGIAMNYSAIDIYDATTDTWTSTDLSEARSNICSVTMGDRIFFAGGSRWINNQFEPSNRVDILNMKTGTWTTDVISEARGSMIGSKVGNKIYFAGGRKANNTVSDRIDIYDDLTNSWSTTSLHEGKLFFAGAASQDHIYWAGGITGNPSVTSSEVEIRDVSSQVSSFTCLSKPVAGLNIIQKGDDIIFFPGYPSWNVNENTFDIYNTVSKSWSIGRLNTNISNAAIILVGNDIYVAGGSKTDTEPLSVVWLLHW